MSKRGKLRQRGWIEFKGLQYAEPFMARSELVETIHAFFAERGLSLASRETPLLIRFSRMRNPWVVEDGERMAIAGVHVSEGSSTREIIVYVRKHTTRGEFVNTLYHELDHAAWLLEGRWFDNTLRYRVRPHEIRARGTGREWSRRLSR